jgi:LysR family transcriptional regulator, cys regulon transcriptional activator
MNLQQLRYLHEIARRGLNVSDAAAALYTSQPGVSKQVRLLEEELGIIIFERSGKRLTGITEPGRQVLAIVARMLEDAGNLKRLGEEYADEDSGTLDIATTHTQARYALPPVVKRFMDAFPKVRLRLHQGNPHQVAEWVAGGDADIGIATEALDALPQLVTLPCYHWSHIVIAPQGHPLLAQSGVALADLVQWPLITYDPSFTGRTRIDRAFERAGLTPNIVLTAVDSDVIKTYVELGLGVGVIAEMAFDPARDLALAAVPAGHLIEANTTRLAIRRGNWLRRYDYAFIELFAPQLTRKMVETTLKGGGEDPGL